MVGCPIRNTGFQRLEFTADQDIHDKVTVHLLRDPRGIESVLVDTEIMVWPCHKNREILPVDNGRAVLIRVYPLPPTPQ